MLHDRLLLPVSKYEEIISTLTNTFKMQKAENEKNVYFERTNFSVKLIARVDDQFTMILDYPEELKGTLEQELVIELSGTKRLPTLKEFSQEIRLLSEHYNSLSKSALKDYLGLSDEEMTKLLRDFEKTAKRKRSPKVVKEAYELYKKLI